MDSALAAVHGLEAARPAEDYAPTHALAAAWTHDLRPVPAGSIHAPSRLLGYTPPFVRLHFEAGTDGALRSPQAPPDPWPEAAGARARLRSLAALVGPDRILELAGAEEERPARDLAEAPAAVDAQQFKSAVEQRQREELYSAQNRLGAASARRAPDEAVAAAPAARAPASFREESGPPAAVAEEPAGALRATWIEGELFLLRRVERDGVAVAQGVWLDWPGLEAWLLGRISDLLPEARLEPVGPADPEEAPAANGNRRLAFLPVRLAPGAPAPAVGGGWSPLRTSLAAAWCGAGVGALALVALLRGALRLSERRGAFVSAVTHELRTPLTTFRLYTEMLAGGMIPDEARRRHYLETLRTESERLSHLVENVLSYSRIERGRAAGRVEATTPAELLGRVRERLEARLGQAGMTLRIDCAGDVAERTLETDRTVVEQILFNLVDNAAKYARTPDRPPGGVALEVAATARGGLALRVRDAGPGLPAGARRRLFQPFSKSAHEAANSQPGVGLGLALCRRLARDELHGDLVLEASDARGTVFRLELP